MVTHHIRWFNHYEPPPGAKSDPKSPIFSSASPLQAFWESLSPIIAFLWRIQPGCHVRVNLFEWLVYWLYMAILCAFFLHFFLFLMGYLNIFWYPAISKVSGLTPVAFKIRRNSTYVFMLVSLNILVGSPKFDGGSASHGDPLHPPNSKSTVLNRLHR